MVGFNGLAERRKHCFIFEVSRDVAAIDDGCSLAEALIVSHRAGTRCVANFGFDSTNTTGNCLITGYENEINIVCVLHVGAAAKFY